MYSYLMKNLTFTLGLRGVIDVFLQEIQKMGGFITGCADESLQTLKVVKT